MTVEQLALDLIPLADGTYEQRHQVGHYRAPWDFAAGPAPGVPAPRKGDLVPAWRCCHCGGIEMSRFFLHLSHDCCRTWAKPTCYYQPPKPDGLYRMDARWIAPSTEDRP